MAKKKTHKEFIDEMRVIHPELKVLGQYKLTNVKILVEDVLGIKYLILPLNLLKRQAPSINSAVDRNLAFKILSEQKHGVGKFYYSNVEYTTNDKKVILTCIDCDNQFEQTPREHLQSTKMRGCPNCGVKERGLSKTKNRSKTIIEDIIKVHNNDIRLDLFSYTGMRNKTLFSCNINSEHGYWEATPNNIVKGKGCPLCKTSKGEIKVSKFLKENGIEYIRQKTFNDCKLNQLLYFDFYLPGYNTCIEYDGRQHFEPVKIFGGENGFLKTQERDKIKNEFCKERRINLLRIPYTQFNEIEDLISNSIKQKMTE